MEFSLNGRTVNANGFATHTTLLEYLRSSGLTGTKEGCAEGECGACAVLLVSPGREGSRLRPVNSCLLPLASLAGQEVYTVEGLAANGTLSAPQQAIAENGGSQCGYCTPGFVISLFAEYYRPERTGPCDPHSMSGNLCRCTGYRPLAAAAASLGEPGDERFLERLRRPAPALAPFSYAYEGARFERPASLQECLRLMRSQPEARLIAGATDLAVEGNLRGRRFPLLVSLEGIPELETFTETAEAIEIGAGLTLAGLADHWVSAPPAFRGWLALFASPLIRNRATLGGNLATASPVGDSAPLLLALDAELRVASLESSRYIPLREFFPAYRKTALRPGELIVSIRVPKPLPSRLVFYKGAKRIMDDISTVAAAFSLDVDRQGSITRARAAYGGVAATPLLVPEFERAVLGREWTESTVELAQPAVAAALTPLSDHRGSAAYRLALAQSFIRKFWWETREAVAA